MQNTFDKLVNNLLNEYNMNTSGGPTNYKIVNVYTGYAENDIQDIEDETSTLPLHQFTDMVGDRLLKNVEEGGEYGDKAKEFFGFSQTVEIDGIGEVGLVSNGEENILVIVPEGHEWYDKVSYDMDDSTYGEWVEFINKLDEKA